MNCYPSLLLFAAVFLGCCLAVRAVTPEEGRRMYLEAKEGDVEAQYRLGLCFLKGDGVKRSPSQARFWLNKAAAQNHRAAKRSLLLIPKQPALPVNPSTDPVTREKKGRELYEYLYKHKDYKPERKYTYETYGRKKKATAPAQGTAPDPAAVSALIRAGANVNYQGEDMNSLKSCPLSLLLRMELFDLADLLIANGADVNLELTESGKLNSSFSLLSFHCNNGNLLPAEYLLKNGADPDYVNQYGFPLLVWYARHGNDTVTALLLKYGADPEKMTEQPRMKGFKADALHTALWAAANARGIEEAKLEAVSSMLIRHKADVNHRASNGTTPLDRAVSTGKNSLARLLKDAGAKTSRELDGK